MRSAWVAGAVRARLLASRRLGSGGAREVAAAGSVPGAVAIVASSPYGRFVDPTMTVPAAQHGVRRAALWHLRILAGWLPPDGSEVIRSLAAGYDIANIEGHLDALAGIAPGPPFELGALAVAWPRVRDTRSVAEVRAALAGSSWRDPGSDQRASISAALRIAAFLRVADRVPVLASHARAAGAVVVAAERFGHGRALPEPAALDARRLLGPAADSPDLATLAAALSGDVRWVLAEIQRGSEIWRAEARWWRRLGEDAEHGTRRSTPGDATVAWSAVALLTDAHQVCGALEAAAWGTTGWETFDAVA
jgi:hypothetical protein